LLPSTPSAASNVLDATDALTSSTKTALSPACQFTSLPTTLNAVGLLSDFANRVGSMNLDVWSSILSIFPCV
jgi:hypothetical protein